MAKNIIPIDAAAKRLYLQDEGDNSNIVTDIYSDLDAVRTFFEEIFVEGEENVRFYKNRQWTEEEKEAHREQNRHPYEINEVHSKINHLVGTQTNTKLDAKAMGRDRLDSTQAEILTSLIKWAEQLNDLDTLQREVFRQTLLRGASACSVRYEFMDTNYGFPKVERVPIYELMWDTNAREISLDDARWMARVMLKTRQELVETFPDLYDEIMDVSGYEVGSGGTYYSFRPDHIESHGTYYSSTGKRRRDMIEVIEHYEKVITTRYIVINDIEGTEFAYEDKEEAQDYYEFLLSMYNDKGLDIEYPDGSPKVSLNISCRDSFIQTIIAGEKILWRQMTALPAFPFIVNFCYFEDGDYWAFSSYLKDPQRLINRSMSTWDYQLGKSVQNLITVNMSFLPRGNTYEDLRNDLSQTNPIVRVLDHRAIQLHNSQSAQPELFQNINFAIQRMQEYAGGRNSLGLQESAAESGRAVLARSEQAGIGKLPLFDNLRIWRLKLTEMVVWYIKNFMPNQQIIQIIGNDDHIAFEPIDDGTMETLREQRYNIIISEAADTDSIRVEQFEQLVKMASQIQIPAPVMQDILIELSALPESTKEKIREKTEFYQEWQQQKQKMAEEQKIQGEVQRSIQKAQLREQMKSGAEQPPQEAARKDGTAALDIALEDFQRMQQSMAQENLSPQEKERLYSQVQEPGDVQGAQRASILGGMGIR